MKCRTPRSQVLPTAALGLALALGVATTGCRTTADDVHRWANTAQGPRKLVSVLVHDKYPHELRVEAGMTLVTMRPRAGRRVGINELIDALNEMPEEPRNKVVAGMIPTMVAEIKKPPTGKGESRLDSSIPHKDAAFAMLTNERGSLVADKALVEQLHAALAQWAVTDFSNRMDDSSQKYSVEQVLRMLGSRGVKNLPALIQADAPKIDKIAGLIADLGDKEAKEHASQKLVAVAKEVAAERWLRAKAPKVEAANKASKLTPTKEQFEKQLGQYQEEELLRVFGSMKKIGQGASVEYLLAFAADKSQVEKRRAAALAALEGRLDRNNESHVKQALELAGGDDTPDVVRDVALRRVGEMPRKLVIERLYNLFRHDNWKIRWVAAELVLKMSDQTHLKEFMRKLGRTKGMAITEPLRYGKLIGALKGKEAPTAIIDKYAARYYPSPVRVSALGYYYEMGDKSQLAAVTRYAGDSGKVPECAEDAQDCEWQCAVGSGKKKELKQITTVGEFVQHCIQPAMEKRDKPVKKKKEEEKK